MNDKSIIGFGYKPNFAKAVCLKTNSTTRLGDVEYKIIADPYEREFVELEPVPLSLFGEKKKVLHTEMAVNVLDSVTGLTYAVEYAPANLIRPPKEYKWGDIEILVGNRPLPVATIDIAKEKKPGKSTDFIQRMKEIINELEAMINADPDFEKDCGLGIFAMRKATDGKAHTGVSFICGAEKNVVDSLVAAGMKGRNDKVINVLDKARRKALYQRVSRNLINELYG